MIGGWYSYDYIYNTYAIHSTIKDYKNGILIGYKLGLYYYFKKHNNIEPVNDEKIDLSMRNYILTKISNHYGTWYRI